MTVVFTVLSLSVLATILAGIVVLADYKLNNYGICKIDINDGARSLEVNGGSSLLSTLASQKIFIPSACGGKATCGLCKVTLAESAGPVLPTEEPYLSAVEMESGVRLSCQVKVKHDLKISIPEEFFNVKQYRTRVQEIKQLTHDIKQFRFQLLEPTTIGFKAGQYVQIDSKPYDKVTEAVSRAYSISSVPSENNIIELIIRLVPGGICTTFLHEHLKEGDEITFAGPFGDFYLHEGGDELIFIAGGSGLAPIRSLVLDILEKNLDKKMKFFFGAVRKRDLYYLDFFRELEAKYDNFTYIPALSGATPEDEWAGDEGLITDVVARHVPDAEGRQAYLCGSPGMINACIQVLTRIGFGRDAIFFDEF
ncbi:MAG TPA: 2Fe-2S iron-sulfur cluster binding domain-containing protein [Limnochordia bacterium]|nr:2Fe-2S iron-sulfur cluster binding domain-containing protein [Limnochordia bacterium]